EMYGFGLKKKPRSGEDEVEANEEANGSEADYDAEDFAYLLIYLPEGIGSSKADKELAEEICMYNDEAITGPCMILVYTGFYGHNESIWNALNPLHYFEFHFDETLNNVSTASGTHGSYDPYGEAGGSIIKVLKDATLYRPSLAEWGVREEKAVPARPYPDDEYFRLNSLEDDEDEVEPQEKPEEFYIPTVSYTVPGGGGNSGGRSSGGLSSTTITEPQVPLAELPELNKKDHVAYVIGYEDGTVRPENLITRAEVSTIFFRLLTDDSRQAIWSSSNSYRDTAADAWYNNAVSTLSNGGVLSGYTDGTFLPSGNITRAEFATIAARFDESTVDTSSVSFSDISGHWAENNIKRAAALGYITGYQDGSFKPNAPITRAEAMTLMNRVLGRDKISAAGLLDNMAKWSDNPATAWYYVAVQEATNTHDYTITDGVETWTSILANRDWAALEKEWATGAERGAEVFQPVEEETPATESEAGTEAEA
ncbi:MAG: S-layer homology domain-containing protein, partial [Clostridia bacterium]|nr:S-layer homology domain-containing protein [Clostridia bacterium]